MKKVIVLVGPQTRQRASGVSLAFDLLVHELVQRSLPHKIVDLNSGGVVRRPGSFSPIRFIACTYMVLSFWRRLFSAETIYITIASSRFGFLRDAIMIWSARMAGKRIVLHLHGGGYTLFYSRQLRVGKSLIAATLSLADTIIVLGSSLRAQFNFVANWEAKVQVVANGLPLGLYAGRENNVSPYSVHDRVRMLYLSNMIGSKGYLDVLEAGRILHGQRHIPVHIDFCGDFVSTSLDRNGHDPRETQIQFLEKIDSWGLREVAVYHGFVSGKIKSEMLRSCHFLVLPTWYEWEGQPICIIEALAYGKPVIATKYRAIAQQIIDGQNGFFVPPRAPDRIADIVESVWKNPDTYPALSSNAFRRFESSYTAKRHLDTLISILTGGLSSESQITSRSASQTVR